jgi:hypothetical protein
MSVVEACLAAPTSCDSQVRYTLELSHLGNPFSFEGLGYNGCDEKSAPLHTHTQSVVWLDENSRLSLFLFPVQNASLSVSPTKG